MRAEQYTSSGGFPRYLGPQSHRHFFPPLLPAKATELPVLEQENRHYLAVSPFLSKPKRDARYCLSRHSTSLTVELFPNIDDG